MGQPIYEQVFTGDWLPYKRRDQYLRCCDCCLVHRLNFRVRKGKIEIQFTVDKRATSASRRANGIKIVQTNPKKKR